MYGKQWEGGRNKSVRVGGRCEGVCMRKECERGGRKEGSVAIDAIVDVITGYGVQHHGYTSVILHVYGGGLYEQ